MKAKLFSRVITFVLALFILSSVTNADYLPNPAYELLTYQREDNLMIIWNDPDYDMEYNAFAIYVQKNEDFVEGDLIIGFEPIPYMIEGQAGPGISDYSYEMPVDGAGTYYTILGVGNYVNGHWESYGHYSETYVYEIEGGVSDDDFIELSIDSEPAPINDIIQIDSGDVVTFTRHIESSGTTNASWSWVFPQEFLDCRAYPEFDSPNLRCEVIDEGTGSVFFQMYAIFGDGDGQSFKSNRINVNVGDVEINPVSVPPAGYEDDVITVFTNYENPFPDTDLDTLEGRAAAELYRRAVIGGYLDGEFKGWREVNRAEAAKFLLLARYGEVADVPNNGMFWDVLDGEWYTKFVVTAAIKGIINGYDDGTFRPGVQVNTAEFLKMLAETFELEENLPYDFIDVSADSWYAKYAGLVQEYDLMPNRGMSLYPGRFMTRNEVAVAIYQYLSLR